MPDIESELRSKIADWARAEATRATPPGDLQNRLRVAAALADKRDPTRRRGWDRLTDYFGVVTNGFESPENIEFLVDRQGRKRPLKDWCGIFALCAIRKILDPQANRLAGDRNEHQWAGDWTTAISSQGLNGVWNLEQTSSPGPGDIACVRDNNHMSLIVEVNGGLIKKIDGNSNFGGVIGPSETGKAKSSFDSGFFTAFASPAGTWEVQVGVWNWLYSFHNDGKANWSDIRTPPQQTGVGTWKKKNNFMEINWDTGACEQWDLPLRRNGQLGNLVGQGRIVKAQKQ